MCPGLGTNLIVSHECCVITLMSVCRVEDDVSVLTARFVVMPRGWHEPALLLHWIVQWILEQELCCFVQWTTVMLAVING